MRSSIIVAACVAVIAGFSSCSSKTSLSVDPSDPSIVVNGGVRVDDRVENGAAHDWAVVDLAKAKKVVLPVDAVIRRSAEAGKLQLFIAKTLAFGGHPPESMNIRSARKKMGVRFGVSANPWYWRHTGSGIRTSRAERT
jgi:hypothetical protein